MGFAVCIVIVCHGCRCAIVLAIGVRRSFRVFEKCAQCSFVRRRRGVPRSAFITPQVDIIMMVQLTSTQLQVVSSFADRKY